MFTSLGCVLFTTPLELASYRLVAFLWMWIVLSSLGWIRCRIVAAFERAEGWIPATQMDTD